METGIPVATDNIYKFYALFGLLLLISCGLGFVYIHKTTNEIGYQTYIDLETLKAKPNRSKEEEIRFGVLQQRQDIDKADYLFYLRALGYGAGIALSMMVGGFVVWHYRVQKELDCMMRLQLEKVELEIKQLRRASRK